jgi:hypothetical protein
MSLANSEYVELTTAREASCIRLAPTWNEMEVNQKPFGI